MSEEIIWKDMSGEFVNYSISSLSEVRDKITHKKISIYGNRVKLVTVNKITKNLTLSKLMLEYFPVFEDPDIVWKTMSEEFSNYEVSSLSEVRNKTTHKKLIPYRNRVNLLTINKEPKSFTINVLMKKYFPIDDEPGVIWKNIRDCEGYEISSQSKVRNQKTGKILSIGNDNIVTVKMNGLFKTFSILTLMREHFPVIDNPNVIWKVITDFSNYDVSNLGNIRNTKTKKILNGSKNNGYICVGLINNDNILKSLPIHRIVAQAFIPNDDINKKVVNHLDGIKHNNNLNNLEWCSPQENSQHAIDTGLVKISKRAVYQLSLDNILVDTFESITDASKATDFNPQYIIECCKNEKPSYKEFKWKYVDENVQGRTEKEMKNLPSEEWRQIKDSNLHQISSLGRVRNVETGYILQTTISMDKREYTHIKILDKYKTYLVHRLVAMTFLPNFYDLAEVQHCDKNSLNNKVYNLKWISTLDNRRHSGAKSVNQLNLDGDFIKKWNCIKDASLELNIHASSIYACSLEKRKTAGNFKWEYSIDIIE